MAIGLIIAAAIVFGGLLNYSLLVLPLAVPLGITLPLIAANSWVERRSRGQLPPRPAQGSQAPEVQPPGRAGQDPALPLDGSLDGPPDGGPDRPDQARADLRPDSSPPGWPHSPGRGARTPRGIRPVPGAV